MFVQKYAVQSLFIYLPFYRQIHKVTIIELSIKKIKNEDTSVAKGILITITQ